MTASADLTTILSAEAVEALRAQYAPEFMLAASRYAVAAPYPPNAGYVEWIIGSLYDGKRIAAKDRERTLIALLASQSTGHSLLLAVHLYWGLMEGLTVAEIADTLALSGVYLGLPHYTAALGTLSGTLKILGFLAARPEAKLDPKVVVGALKAAIQPDIAPPSA